MRHRAAIAAAIVAAILALFVLLLATSDTEQTGSANFEIINQIGPDFTGPTIGGGEFSLREHRGDWVVLNFFASWCVGCRVEHPELIEFSERHANDNVQLVSVMFGDTEKKALEFFEELGGEWPTLVEGTGRIGIDYSVTAVPETLLISPSGRVVFKWLGSRGVTADGLDEAIVAFSAPAPDPVPAN